VRRLVNEELAAGLFTKSWDGRDDAGRPAGSGIYFVRMRAGNTGRSYKVSLLR
jgi:flagellar hook assembly protein FlgD